MKQLLYLALSLLLCSCGTMRHTQMQVAERIRKDTIYLSNIQYDSIYIYNNVYQDRSRDTLLIKETNIEYRYKLLRDTVRIVQRDSIPYEVRITEVKEVPRKRTWMDHLCYTITGIVSGLILVFFLRKFKILKL